MKKVLQFLKRHTWLILIFTFLLFVPQSFSYQAKLNMRVIVTGMGVDKSDDGYEITAQVVMPSPGSESGGGSAKIGLISEQGKNISEGVRKIAYKIGKTAGLSHMSFLVVGQSMLGENLTETLDYFVRDHELNASVMMLVSPTTAKDMISKTKDLELSASVGLQKVFIYKQASLNGLMMPIEEFISNAFELSKSSAVGGLFISNEGEEVLGENTSASVEKQSEESENSQEGSDQSGQEQSESGGGESKQSGDQGGSSQEGRIKYFNDVYYFKNGKYVNKLDKEDELIGYFLTAEALNNGELTVENVTGGVLQNATVGLQFRAEKTKRKIKFENGCPVLKFEIKIKDMQVVEMLNEEMSEKQFQDLDEETVRAIKDAVAQTVEKNITKVFEKTKADGVDIFKFADNCYRFKPGQWKTLYNAYGDEYLNQVQIQVETKITNIN